MIIAQRDDWQSPAKISGHLRIRDHSARYRALMRIKLRSEISTAATSSGASSEIDICQ
jgi:hypothetical protein